MKNLVFSPGLLVQRDPATGNEIFANNDSIWMDLGHPVMTAPDGRRYKPLLAPLIVDLDNRINVNGGPPETLAEIAPVFGGSWSRYGTIVIGTGSGGAACAGTLAAHGTDSVLALESGPDYGSFHEGRSHPGAGPRRVPGRPG